MAPVCLRAGFDHPAPPDRTPAGETVETAAEEYALTVEQVRSALSYAAHVAAHLPPAVRQVS
jgi:hypothetical protein